MLHVRVESDLEQRYAVLAQKTGRTKSYYIRKALEEAIEDMEDTEMALEALREGGTPVPIETLMKDLGMDREDKPDA